MIQPLVIEHGIDTPGINFVPSKGYFEISGKSFPEDVKLFFDPIMEWFDNYLLNPVKENTFVLKLDYFNTASSKLLLELFYKFEKLHKRGFYVTVNWHYPDDDEDMQETGIEYAQIVSLPFNQIGYTVMFK